MRISDWSSDVCSSDLPRTPSTAPRQSEIAAAWIDRHGRLPQGEMMESSIRPLDLWLRICHRVDGCDLMGHGMARDVEPLTTAGCMQPALEMPTLEIGRASCRERVWQYV